MANLSDETPILDPKERRRVREREKYAANREARAKYAKQYREENKKKVRDWSLKSYHAQKERDPLFLERHNKSSNAWREKNRERVRAQERARWAANPEIRAKKNARRKAKKEQYAEYAKKSRAKNYVWNLVRLAESRAKREGLAFDLTREWAEGRWTGHCELTGIAFAHRQGTGRGSAGPFSASLDKIEPSRGYVKDNCRFILWAVNRFKGKDSDEIFMQVARALVSKENSNG